VALIILGLFIWSAAHLVRSFAPDLRNQLQNRFGNMSKALFAVAILFGLFLMIAGYRSAEYHEIWSPPYWLRYVNNLLMLLAVYIYFTTATKPGTAFLFGSMKNPQLTGFKIWAAAHLLVNGHLAAIVLFGGLLVWAIIEIIGAKKVTSLVNRDKAPINSGWIHLALTIFAFTAISLVHYKLGVTPFG